MVHVPNGQAELDHVTSTAYDTVIVGAGSAGCVLANRLSADPERTVLLLEAGPSFVEPHEYPDAVRDERRMTSELLWHYPGFRRKGDTEPLDVVRGRVIGGSGAVNGMAYQRGAPEDYDSWGSELWTYQALVPYFQKIERYPEGHAPDRGTTGQIPLHTLERRCWSPSQEAFHRSAVEIGFPEVADLMQKTPAGGVGPVVRNSEDGVRQSGGLTYVAAVRDRPNLTVRGESVVHRVVVSDGRATGVDVTVAGRREIVDAGEVVLCGGAIESVKLLVLSGIGPSALLHGLGIPVVHHAPAVGANLTDHPLVPVRVRLKDGTENGDPRFIVGLEYTAEGSDTRNDILFFTCSGAFGAGLAASTADGTDTEMAIYVMLQAPESTGEVRVTSADPAVAPEIRYCYLESDNDRRRMRDGVRTATRILRSPACREIVDQDLGPTERELASDTELDAWIASALQTTRHGTGTCAMGPDPAAVVDYRGRVRGVDRLRVADLSVAPRVVRSPTHATAMVIAERLADLMEVDATRT